MMVRRAWYGGDYYLVHIRFPCKGASFPFVVGWHAVWLVSLLPTCKVFFMLWIIPTAYYSLRGPIYIYLLSYRNSKAAYKYSIAWHGVQPTSWRRRAFCAARNMEHSKIHTYTCKQLTSSYHHFPNSSAHLGKETLGRLRLTPRYFVSWIRSSRSLPHTVWAKSGQTLLPLIRRWDTAVASC